MGAVQQRFTGLVAKLRKQYPQGVVHVDDTEAVQPKELANRIHYMFTGQVMEPAFIHKPGVRTIVEPQAGGGMKYISVPMADVQP